MNREAIYTALYNLVSQAASFVTTGRRVVMWTDLSSAQKPALFVGERGGNYVRASQAVPQKVTLEADVYIYTAAGEDPNVVPATQLNQLLDAVDAALSPSPVTGLQTLGGLVAHCWVEGKVIAEPGDIDGQGVAVMPVKILVPY